MLGWGAMLGLGAKMGLGQARWSARMALFQSPNPVAAPDYRWGQCLADYEQGNGPIIKVKKSRISLEYTKALLLKINLNISKTNVLNK